MRPYRRQTAFVVAESVEISASPRGQLPGHELLEDPTPTEHGGYLLLCLTGPIGDEARATLSASARVTWTVEAGSLVEAMTQYYEHQEWWTSTTDFPEVDAQTYRERGWD